MLEVVVAHSVATLSSALRAVQGEGLDAESRAKDIDACLRIVEQHLDNVRDKLARDSGLSDTPTQTAIAAVVVPAWGQPLTMGRKPFRAPSNPLPPA